MNINLTDGIQIKQEFEQFKFLMKTEPYLHERLLLHLFKKIKPQYQNKQLIFLANWISEYSELYKNTNSLRSLDWSSIPDVLVYDKKDGTYTTMQYKFAGKHSFEDFEDPDFASIYNQTIHVMNIISVDQEDFEIVYNIMQQQQYKCNFDVKIQTVYTYTYSNLDLPVILKQVDELDGAFMEKEGQQIKNSFFKDFDNKNYSKFKYDKQFITEFYEFVKTYTIKDNLGVGIEAQKLKK